MIVRLKLFGNARRSTADPEVGAQGDVPPEALRKREAFNESVALSLGQPWAPPEALRKREAFNAHR